MPFRSKKQMSAAFGGYLGSEMKRKAKQWADETPNISKLPMRKKQKKSKEDSKKEEMSEMRKMHKNKMRSAAHKAFGGRY